MHLQLRRGSRLTSPAFCSVSTVSKGVEGTGKCCLGFYHWPKGDWNICYSYGKSLENHGWNWWNYRVWQGECGIEYEAVPGEHQNSWQMEVNPTKIWYHILIGYLLYICIYLIESRKQKWDADRYMYIHTHMYAFKYIYIIYVCIYIYMVAYLMFLTICMYPQP